MNHPITLPQAIIKQAITEKLDYEEWFAKQVAAGMADEKAGRVYGKDQFWEQLSKAKVSARKQPEFAARAFLHIAAAELDFWFMPAAEFLRPTLDRPVSR